MSIYVKQDAQFFLKKKKNRFYKIDGSFLSKLLPEH